jgi:hypothetical protein
LSVFVDQAAENVGSLNGEAGVVASAEDGTGQGWTLVEGSVWPVLVVVGLVLGEDGSELAFAHDQ